MVVTTVRPDESLSVFAGLPEDTLGALDRLFRTVRTPASGTVFVEGESVDGLYVLYSGLVKITRLSVDGSEQLIDILAPGDIVGEMGLCDGGPRSATATAIVDCTFRRVAKGAFFAFADTHPAVYRVLLGALSDRLRTTNHSFARNQFLPVAGRVAAVLLRLAESMGVPSGPNCVVIEHPLTHRDIAAMIGAARECVSRALADLKKRGVIRTSPHCLTLVDTGRLRAMALI